MSESSVDADADGEGFVTYGAEFEFVGGFPTPETVERAYDSVDLNRAIHAYRFFYPTLSAIGMERGFQTQGLHANKVIGLATTTPNQIAYTPNSDTPYAPTMLDLRDGPIVIEMPQGPLICVVIDVNMRWVADLGIPGPDAGKGGKHLLLPPDYAGDVPDGYHVWKSPTNRVIVVVRAIPIEGDLGAARALARAIRIEPLTPPADWKPIEWIDISGIPTKASPESLGWDGTIAYWRTLHELIDSEPAFEGYRTHYGDLAALGIIKGRPFSPDARMTRILEEAARIGDAQMRVQSFADRRPDRLAWPDRRWEWAALRFEDGDFNTADYVDLEAREKWFYQATFASPAMFRRTTAAGSLYWLGTRDSTGAYLDGGKSYGLTVPLPIPARLFWSVTVYDAQSRSEIITEQNQPALRSLFELTQTPGDTIDLYFGPQPPAGKESTWVQTNPGRGWFSYFRIYGPLEPAFDGGWRPGDFQLLE